VTSASLRPLNSNVSNNIKWSLKLNKLELEFEDGNKITGTWELNEELLTLQIGEKEFHIDSDGDLTVGVFSFIKHLGKRIYKKPLHINSCLTCKNFIMSGMARDMGRGQRGVCEFHNNKGVEICFICENYTK